MTSSRTINNDDEYIDGLLDSSPAIVDAIYKHFSRKVKHLVIGWGGSIREAASVFEDVLLDFYDYGRQHKLILTNHFEPFFLYACQLKWKQTLMQKAPGKAQSLHPEIPPPGLDEQHIKYINDALAVTPPDHFDSTRDELEEILADQRERWFHIKDHPNSRITLYVIVTAVVAAGLAGLLFLSPWHKDVYQQFSGTEMVHHHHDHMNETDTALMMHRASYDFNSGHFHAAITELGQVLAKDSLNTSARYFRGVSLVDVGQQDDARRDLSIVYNGKDSYKYDAAFYIALSYLRERDKQQCLEWLLKIPESAPIYWKVSRLKEELTNQR
jgi:tetratricopeptide (TPR) repeat protein